MSDMFCPWCHEGSFDAIGLKLHIIRGHCDVFEATPLADPAPNEFSGGNE